MVLDDYALRIYARIRYGNVPSALTAILGVPVVSRADCVERLLRLAFAHVHNHICLIPPVMLRAALCDLRAELAASGEDVMIAHGISSCASCLEAAREELMTYVGCDCQVEDADEDANARCGLCAFWSMIGRNTAVRVDPLELRAPRGQVVAGPRGALIPFAMGRCFRCDFSALVVVASEWPRSADYNVVQCLRFAVRGGQWGALHSLQREFSIHLLTAMRLEGNPAYESRNDAPELLAARARQSDDLLARVCVHCDRVANAKHLHQSFFAR